MSVFRLALSLLLLALLAVAAPARAQDKDPATLAMEAMQRRYETLGSFSADFTQRLTNAASGETRERGGKVWFKRPTLVRWETLTPEPELLVIGAEDVWNWFPEDKAAYRYTAPQVLESRTMLRFLSGQARLDQDFWVEDKGLKEGLRVLQLMPKNPEPTLVEASMAIDEARGIMTRLTVVDFFGNLNDVRLDNLVLDADCPDALFRFTPPKDADVFDSRETGQGPVEQPLTQ